MSITQYYSVTNKDIEVVRARQLHTAAFAWRQNPLTSKVYRMDVVAGDRNQRAQRVDQLSEPFLREVLRQGAVRAKVLEDLRDSGR